MTPRLTLSFLALVLAVLVSGAIWSALSSLLVAAAPLTAPRDLAPWYSDDGRMSTRRREYLPSPPAPRRPSALLKRSGRISRTSQEPKGRGFSRAPYSGFSKSVGLRASPEEMPPCAHIGDSINQVSARAYLATTVFEGKARSRSPVRDPPGGPYAVTFVVQAVHKQAVEAVRPGSQVRLQFRERQSHPRPQGQCDQSYNFTRRPGELVRASIKRGGKYIVFVTGNGPHNFSVLGEPVFRTRKNLQAVKDVLCRNCGRQADVFGLYDVTVTVKTRLRLVCRCKGNPLPALHWYKDGLKVNTSRTLRIQYKKRRSSLVIPRVRPEDAGRYECRATSVTGSSHVTRATVTVNALTQATVSDNTTTLWPLFGGPCPIDSYCLNGGTCTYYETVGELVCQCAEGYKGQRCESKDVYNRSSMYRPMSYFCKLGISSTYYC